MHGFARLPLTMSVPPPRSPTAVRWIALICLAPILAAAAAVWRQDFGGALPLGLFNEGRAVYEGLAAIMLAGLLGAAAALAFEGIRGRTLGLAGAVRGALAAFLVTELLVTALDVGLVSRDRGAGLGGPYREAQSVAGTRVFLKRPHPGSPLGFRTATPYAKVPAGRRVLFLGDSYTEGSGRSPECNYPEVALAVARDRLGPEWEGMNAGVAGYGPADSLALLRFLEEEGYEFDAVVWSLFLENDFTDDLPGTERRVVAGINFRFPQSPFLRWVHPLNSRTFRYALFVARAAQLRGASDDAVRRGDGECRPPGPLADPLPEELEALVRRRLEASYREPLAPLATGVVAESLEAFTAETRRLGVPLVWVVFPDRVLADTELQARLGWDGDPAGYDLDRLTRWVRERAGDVPLVELVEPLRGPASNYRGSDTHLSDEGNVVAGRHVGERLADHFGVSPTSD